MTATVNRNPYRLSGGAPPSPTRRRCSSPRAPGCAASTQRRVESAAARRLDVWDIRPPDMWSGVAEDTGWSPRNLVFLDQL